MGDLDDELRDALAQSENQTDSAEQTDSGNVTAAQNGSVPLAVGAAGIAGDEVGIALDTAGASGSRPDEPSRNLGLLAALLVVGAGILTLVFTSADDAAIYSVSTDQLVSQKEKYKGRNVRVVGDLVSGSLKHRKEPCEYRFKIEKNGKSMAVRYPECIVPDTFKDVPGVEVQVTAEGKLNSEGHFDATHIMAKCPSKYEMQQRAEKGEDAPHSVMGELPDLPAEEN